MRLVGAVDDDGAVAIGAEGGGKLGGAVVWGVGTGANARKMMADAARIESTSTLKATDDYFFEDAWRQNADSLTFQLIPGACVLGKGDPSLNLESFFVFGSSGNVAEFKGKVEQHKGMTKPTIRQSITKAGKAVLRRLPQPVARRAVGRAREQRGLLDETLVVIGTEFGRTVYAIGGNERSALLMGLPVPEDQSDARTDR